jgi:hypothetical protein
LLDLYGLDTGLNILRNDRAILLVFSCFPFVFLSSGYPYSSFPQCVCHRLGFILLHIDVLLLLVIFIILLVLVLFGRQLVFYYVIVVVCGCALASTSI